ncbi:MAG: hypothetical protein KJO49_11880 [Bacteroidia bacterium]|nr:hypothetical protein [Bacteroidia bacterium]MBT8269040.1 hypothetical protein [Bacteroidia bacterium]NNF82912.1 hypothetical protein [Flavobacteriaceae bacterium]NNK70079.1 hypothetical protein [Flavobacteriaceae bacterium]NNL79687.1 hypothetical protein [Flavobacteriaceae bacterium]
MKTLKSFLLIAAIAFSSVLSASTNPNAEKAKTAESTVITSEVSKLLQNPTFLVDEDIYANVTLTINKHNEIVVLSVDSEDNMLEGFIKGRLNYQSLPKAIKKSDRTFVVPVKIEAELF